MCATTMKAMLLEKPGSPLVAAVLPIPEPGPGQLLVKVHACAICRTDLHVVDGELDEPTLPLVPGHQIVGTVAGGGGGLPEEAPFPGSRVGIPWLGGTCGHCHYCEAGQENLCDEAIFTGYQVNGGFAEYVVADARFCLPLPRDYPDLQVAPLLCAGLIGFRSLRLAGEGKRLGLYGFGAAAHLVAQVARHQGREVYAFTREEDLKAQAFARRLGATWAGDSSAQPDEALDAAIIFAPVGPLVPLALAALRKGGTLVLGGIHMSEIPAMPYELLWGERVIRSVANLTRRDGEEFLALAPQIPIETEVHSYPLSAANEALDDLREGRFTGAAALIVDEAAVLGSAIRANWPDPMDEPDEPDEPGGSA